MRIGVLVVAAITQLPPNSSAAQTPVGERLENGIVVLAVPSEAPAMTLTVAFFFGYRDESAEMSGAAHLLEHLAVRETDSVLSIAAGVERLGARPGAITTGDVTAFSATAPSSSDSILHGLLELERQRMTELRITDSAVEAERRRISIEIAGRGDPSTGFPPPPSGSRLARAKEWEIQTPSGRRRQGV